VHSSFVPRPHRGRGYCLPTPRPPQGISFFDEVPQPSGEQVDEFGPRKAGKGDVSQYLFILGQGLTANPIDFPLPARRLRAGDAGQQVEKLLSREVGERSLTEPLLLLGERQLTPLDKEARDLYAVNRQERDMPDQGPVHGRGLAREKDDAKEQGNARQDAQPEDVPRQKRDEIDEVRNVDARLDQEVLGGRDKRRDAAAFRCAGTEMHSSPHGLNPTRTVAHRSKMYAMGILRRMNKMGILRKRAVCLKPLFAFPVVHRIVIGKGWESTSERCDTSARRAARAGLSYLK
jgi:hypothetical protein